MTWRDSHESSLQPLVHAVPQHAQLLAYLILLAKWNAVYNLTAVRDPQAMVTQHLLDSLAAVPAFAGARNVLDVGAGGGLPGMVLAIARPDMQVAMKRHPERLAGTGHGRGMPSHTAPPSIVRLQSCAERPIA